MTEIETARLLLRPWQADDLAEFTRLLTDPEVTRYIVVHTPFSPTASRSWGWSGSSASPWPPTPRRGG